MGAAVPLHLQELYTQLVKAMPGWGATALGRRYSRRHYSCRGRAAQHPQHSGSAMAFAAPKGTTQLRFEPPSAASPHSGQNLALQQAH